MPIPNTSVLSRSFMRDDVYQSLRRWIVTGELKPGEKLRDKELAAHLGVSRTPVRESLRKLEDEGLVETSPNRWTRVSLVSREDAENIYPIIEQLELLALTQAFPLLTPQQVETMRSLNARLDNAIASCDTEKAADIDASFHKVLIDAAQNVELATILETVKAKYHRIELTYFSSVEFMSASVADHNQLIAALEARDLEAAKQALTQNWFASIDRLRALKLRDADS